MDDLRLGLALKAARLRRRLRQSDVATQAGVSATLVSRLEHGGAERISLHKLRAVAARLGVSLDIVPRSAGAELERVVGARHAALGELVAAWIARQPGWVVVPERSFSIYGERGVIDLLAWHKTSCSVVAIELKTAIVNVNELIGTLDRKRRLAPQVATDLGWEARSVSAWLIVAESSTNRRRVGDHRTLLGSAFPLDGRSLAPLFLHPERGLGSGIAFWSDSHTVKVRREVAAPKRVVKPRHTARGPDPRSGPSLGSRL